MSKHIQPFVTSILSALLIPLFCFALPAFGGMPLVAPAAQAPSAACAAIAPEAPLSGRNNKPDPVFFSYPSDPIPSSTAKYCNYSTTTGNAIESTSHTSGTMY